MIPDDHQLLVSSFPLSTDNGLAGRHKTPYAGAERILLLENVELTMEKLKLAVGVPDVVFLCSPFSHKMSWMRYGIKLSQFLRGLLPTLLSKKLVTN